MEMLEFKNKILHSLRDFYGHDAEVISISVKLDEKDICYVGIVIGFVNEKNKPLPIICINDYFENYKRGHFDLETCIGGIVNHREIYRK